MKRTLITLLIIYLNLMLAYVILATLDKDFISIPQLFSSIENVLSILIIPFVITLVGYLIFLIFRFITRLIIKLVRK